MTSNMTKRNLHIFLAAILLSVVAPAYASDGPEMVSTEKKTVFLQSFDKGSEEIVPDSDLRRFAQRMDSLINAGLLGNVSVTGVASVDGNKIKNEILSSERAGAMKEWLVESTDIDANKILLFANGEDWNMFRRLIEDDSNFPDKEDALAVIDSDSSDAIKESRLRAISGGKVWQYLKDNIFPEMRVAIVSLDILSDQNYVAESQPSISNKTEQAVSIEEAGSLSPSNDTDTFTSATVAEENDNYTLSQRMALKTNLLYDAALMPSLELEYRFNARWSVVLEGNVAWWKNDRKHKYYQIATIIPEVRYHLGSDCGWRGHYLGLFAGGGKYDLENGRKGYSGEGGMVGVSYNYVFNVGKSISFEAGLGVGAMYTRYKQYIPKNGHYLYQQTKNLWYGGPLRVKFALVWRFCDYKCKK